ncbi:MAG: hypothetical protein ACE3JP_03380 [Ectobacillus sp.]
MVEQITSLAELQKNYEIVTGRKPKKGDLVYVPVQNGVFEVIHVEGMYIKIERGQKGSGLIMKLPVSYYKLVERKPEQPKKKK